METSRRYAFLDNKTSNSLEKARKCEVVMDYGMGQSTDISIYNYISNILTLHYIQYIISNSFHLSLNKIKYVCFSEKSDFLLWLIFSHTETFLSYFCNNIRNLEEIIAKMHKKVKNADISDKYSIINDLEQVKRYRFRSKTMLNLVKLMIMLLSSDISAKNNLKRIAVKFDRSMTRPDLVKFLLIASSADNSVKKRLSEVRPQFDRSMTKYEGKLQ